LTLKSTTCPCLPSTSTKSPMLSGRSVVCNRDRRGACSHRLRPACSGPSCCTYGGGRAGGYLTNGA
jgi:hypothetical protein